MVPSCKLKWATALLFVLCVGALSPAAAAPDQDLKIVILRHAEKPAKGEHLSCQGQNRAVLLPALIAQKFGRPDYVYVPAIGVGSSTKHARMFETVAPLAIKNNLIVNSKFAEADVSSVGSEVLTLHGTVLMVWEHSQIVPLAQALGVERPPRWPAHDFDGIWTITFPAGRASLVIDKENLAPANECNF